MLNARLSTQVCKLETTKGTAETLAGSDGAENIFDATIEDQTQMIERRQQGGWYRLQHVPGAWLGASRFGVECAGSGASGSVPTWSKYLKMCGLGLSTATFTPTLALASQNSGTIGLYQNGKVRTLYGAMGTFTLTAQNGRDATIPRFDFEMMGIYAAETDAALVTPTYPTVIPPRGIATLTIGGSATCVGRVAFNLNATVTMLPCNGDSGFLHAYVSDFNPVLEIDPTEEVVGTIDRLTQMRDATELDIVVTFGSDANNTVTLTCTDCGIISRPQANVENVLRENLQLSVREGFTIAFS